MDDDAKRLLFVVAYAGSDAGRAALDEFLADIARLRRIESVALDAANISLNDAGPAAFETMAELRSLLKTSEGRDG